MTTACASLAIATTVVEESDGPYLDQLLDQRADNDRPLDRGQSSFSNAIFLKNFFAQNELPIQDIKGSYTLILTLIHLIDLISRRGDTYSILSLSMASSDNSSTRTG
jgi:hypothetical protein